MGGSVCGFGEDITLLAYGNSCIDGEEGLAVSVCSKNNPSMVTTRYGPGPKVDGRDPPIPFEKYTMYQWVDTQQTILN